MVAKSTTGAEKIAERATRWVGSLQSLLVHTVLFLASLSLGWFGVIRLDTMLLVLTTLLSFEAIYLAIFIQMTVNRNTDAIENVEQDVDEIQKDVDEIQEDVDEIQKDVDEIQEDVDEIQEDVEEMTEEEKKEAAAHAGHASSLEEIHTKLRSLMEDIEQLQRRT